jgi:hypothetical protein
MADRAVLFRRIDFELCLVNPCRNTIAGRTGEFIRKGSLFHTIPAQMPLAVGTVVNVTRDAFRTACALEFPHSISFL